MKKQTVFSSFQSLNGRFGAFYRCLKAENPEKPQEPVTNDEKSA